MSLFSLFWYSNLRIGWKKLRVCEVRLFPLINLLTYSLCHLYQNNFQVCFAFYDQYGSCLSNSNMFQYLYIIQKSKNKQHYRMYACRKRVHCTFKSYVRNCWLHKVQSMIYFKLRGLKYFKTKFFSLLKMLAVSWEYSCELYFYHQILFL